ncbi:S-adenosylmethionine synthetase [Candidatus Marsarchaeota G2 archaeon OSP_D]|jgi:S-adenosylmethionine synthetase|uniref:S-adenosylmethionine synthetase n=7 Tax=Candidatus Marsarchaeota group 2 TaxID=2203771 RepID=A0A2R6C4M7_9ARCH|nr:MAG: S-adenosylmethionine synthetase [Candidatus Marsarchaeota G2 archaeon OSP_D]PSN91953.1 MAG: S-adenosylmethionine synthetase [Candidatus Marsarchaeota G2 archaeon ECH_B_SAG-M15]PSN93765.1 MAG: S-adenosylmethionine synthetase [Candidatus Marsarchaeota G2 archaeon ECH_B_SAG-C16]PSN95997.1 MAG: S-adenosylmethionine synthetase [Candidatus Marsarchaeota G2 archaeon ECH_B_2]PSO00773.1 MAG: S-adenosylmethionine synthetase [Candidatus Marsarchaeota G2 archaeon ECH_B_3]PSO02501.1 MAG: S-adenosyl
MDATSISVRLLKGSRVTEQHVEFVERKGLGHPDYIADSVAEEFSRCLSAYYLEEFGTILHHNVDKTLLVGGQARPVYGGGEIITPILIVQAGRATKQVLYDGKLRDVPVGRLAVESAKRWISKNLRYMDPERHIVVDHKINPSSVDLVSLYNAGAKKTPLSNDTSFGVGFAPLTPLEKTVLSVERTLNSEAFKRRVPESGEDIKVMGLRRGDEYVLTVAAAIIAPLVKNYEHYLDVKAKISEEALKVATSIIGSSKINVHVNTADRDADSAYLTVTGSSAEHGDDGAVGRGNRSNGLITPNRPMSLEAVAGKNPVSHVGKIYNLVSQRIADRIVKEFGITEVYVKMLSQIGRPIDNPLQVDLEFLGDNERATIVSKSLESIVREEIEGLPKLTEMLVRGELDVC